jgi:tetratricopeptide (TPR) repeat protein
MTDITSAFLAELRDDLVFRRIDCGLRRLDQHRDLVESFDATAPNAVPFLSYLAQWVDVGYGDAEMVRSLLTGFPHHGLRARLTLNDYIHLRMTEGMMAMASEDADEAISHLEFVLGLNADVENKELLAIANFWLGRCHRKKGEYDSALEHTIKGRDLASELGYPRMAAVMRVLESWLFFQKDKTREAVRILLDAESVLSETDDYLTLGNIYSAQGRMAQREGRYEEATAHFQRAIDEFKKRDPQHRNLARSLANLAYNERLIAQQMARRIDAEMHRRRTAGQRNLSVPSREKLEQVRSSALEHLDQAGAIYAFHPHRRGSGTVHINRGLVFLDAGEWDKAGAEAASGFAHGEPKRDYILMARARLLQCIVENAKFEEQVEERSDPHHHAQTAQSFSTDAVEFARHTQNRRLLARAYIWRGLTLSNEFFQNLESGGECYDLAASALRSEPHDQLWDELQLLKSRIARSGDIDATLRAWSQGAIGNKTFQQMTEEFAAMIIPRVWEREGRKVSRVATRLSVSPKKVRRILKQAGLLNGDGAG